MTTPIVLGLTGAARAGKTIVAEHLRDAHGFTIMSFADPLKDMVRKLDPIIGIDADTHWSAIDPVAYPVHLSDYLGEDGEWLDEFPEDRIKAEFPEYRRVLQTLGTDCLRAYDRNFWRDQMIERIDEYMFPVRGRREYPRIVIPDVRFPNEAEVIHDYIGSGHTDLLNVYRPGASTAAGHISEQHAGHLGEKTMLLNDSTVDALRGLVDAYLEGLKK